MVKIAPSLLAADFRHLQAEISLVEKAGADWLHFDIMDGHFVPNLSYGADVVRQMRSISRLFFDVHLMVEEPLNFLPQFINCGADMLTVHLEACSDVPATIKAIKNLNLKMGISIKPHTSVDAILPYLNEIDNVLIMTVEPGFGGQKFMPEQLQKITFLQQIRQGKNFTIEVDGGINLQTAKQCLTAGADVLVAGSAIFKADNPAEVIKQMHECGEKI